MVFLVWNLLGAPRGWPKSDSTSSHIESSLDLFRAVEHHSVCCDECPCTQNLKRQDYIRRFGIMGWWTLRAITYAITIMGTKIVIRSNGLRDDCDDGHEDCCSQMFVMLHNKIYKSIELVKIRTYLNQVLIIISPCIHAYYSYTILLLVLRPNSYPSATFSKVSNAHRQQPVPSSPAPFHTSLLHHLSPSVEIHTSSSLEMLQERSSLLKSKAKSSR